MTRGKRTLAKAPRSLTHQACKLLDTKVQEKEDGPSAATATTVASLGMCGGTAHAWMKLANPRWLNVRASISRKVKRGTVGCKDIELSRCGQLGFMARLEKGSRGFFGPKASTERDSATRWG